MFKRFVDEAEIEDWFEEEKQRLERAFFDASFKNADVRAGKQPYDEALAKLVKRYRKEHARLDSRIKRHKALRAPVRKARSWLHNLNESFKQYREERSERHKKKQFNKRYDRLMRR